MQLKTIKIGDPVTAEDVNRAFQNVQQALQGDTPADLAVVSLATSPSKNTYTVAYTDEYVIVDASAGPFTVSLPLPKTKQVVTILSGAATSNPITIKRADGQTISGQATFQLIGFTLLFLGLSGAVFVCDGKSWFKAK